ncbi:MAG: proton-conducting transporter membrane subunit [Dehalococcoidia bacterium]|nr:proton-conducting transporter membrane subunit [Dehalococcoidia bacterium]
MLYALVLIPFVGGLLAFLLPSERPQRAVLVAAATAHLGLVVAGFASLPGPEMGGWLQLDPLGLIFLSITSVLFLIASIYAVGYLHREVAEARAPRSDFVEGVLFSNAPERIFVGCMLMFLAAMTLVTLSQHMGLLWVAIEATTLASAPLIYFHRHHRSLEATWKYLLLCSVGIAVALLGTFFLAASTAQDGAGVSGSLVLGDLIRSGGALQSQWLKAAFLLLLVGYGTKMGLAPLHSWLPDAHSESPSLVSALMSGALLNVAFLGILRTYQIAVAAGLGSFAQELLVVFGLLSMGVGAVFIIGQTDYKRMLAYSSVEHMGILSLGVGIGGAAAFGSIFHAINHSLAKGLLFLVAGNVLAMYRTTSVRGVKGMVRTLPVSGPLWVVGFLAITGMPPFGTFFSEFTILQAGLSQGYTLVSVLYLVFLAVVFIGMSAAMLSMAQGEPWAQPTGQHKHREAVLATAPPLILAVAVLVMGLYMPPALDSVLRAAAAMLGAGR